MSSGDMTRKSRLVLGAQSVGFAVAGITLFFLPHHFGEFIFSGASEGVHWHLIRCLGAQFAAHSFGLASAAASDRPETHTTLFFQTLVAFALKLGTLLNAKATNAALFNDAALSYEIILHVCVIVLNLLMLIRSGAPFGVHALGKSQKGFTHMIFLDVTAATMIGCFWMSFPEWLLKRQTVVAMVGTHEFLGRSMGSMFVASGFLSAQALYWEGLRERRFACYARTLMCAGIWTAQVWSQVAYGQWWKGTHWVGISLYSIWLVMSSGFSVEIFRGKFK